MFLQNPRKIIEMLFYMLKLVRKLHVFENISIVPNQQTGNSYEKNKIP